MNKQKLHEKALKFVLTTFAKYSERAETEQKWIDYDKLYNNKASKKTYTTGVANLFVPETRKAVRTLLNFCDECLFAKKPNFKLQGVGGPNDKRKAEINTKILNLQQQKINFRTKVRRFLEGAIIKGTAIAKVSWVQKNKYVLKKLQKRKSIMDVLKRVGTGEFFMPNVQKESVPIYDNIDFNTLKLENVFWDFYKKWEEQEAIIEKIPNVSESDLRIMAKSNDSYFGIEQYLQTHQTGVVEPDVTENYAHTAEIVGTGDTMRVEKDRHELLECWCNFDIDDDGIEEECIITVIDRKEVIRCELNPYDIQEKPYVLFKWEDIEQAESIGIGVPELAKESQLALNDFMNQFMDDLTLILDCMMVVDAQAGIPNSQLKSRPRGIITSQNGVNGITFVRPPNVSDSALRGIQLTKNDIMTVTGASANLQGLPARYDTTATEASAINNSSQREIFTKLRTFEDEVIKAYLRKAYGYNLQFMSSNDVKKIIGEEAFTAYVADMNIKIDKNYDLSDVLLADFDFIPLSVSETENKVVKGQQLMNLYNMAIKSPGGTWNIVELAKKIAEVLNDGDLSIISKEVDSQLISPQDENILMEQGETPFAKQRENHLMHIQVHEAAELNPAYEPIRKKHIEEHVRYLQLQQQQQQQMLQQELLKQLMGNAAKQEAGLPAQEQPTFAPKGMTEQQAAQVPGVVEAPVSLQ